MDLVTTILHTSEFCDILMMTIEKEGIAVIKLKRSQHRTNDVLKSREREEGGCPRRHG